jgi:hypothetical protein
LNSKFQISNSRIQKFKDSKIQGFKDSRIQRFKQFKNSRAAPEGA